MGRHSCCTKQKLRRGLWSPEEDEKLFNYITKFGVGCWSSAPKLAGLQRCGKSCRLRWINYLRPDLKRGMFSQEEEDLIINLHKVLGNRWAQIAAQLPGRTDNEIKNLWNSRLKKKLMKQGIDPTTHNPLRDQQPQLLQACNNDVVSLTHKLPHPIHGLLPPPIMAVKSETSIFMDTCTLTNNELAQHHYGAGHFLVKPPSFEGSSSGFESGLGPTGFNWAHITSQDDWQSQSHNQMSRVYEFGLQCSEAEFQLSAPSIIPRVDSFSLYNTSNEARESSSYSSISSKVNNNNNNNNMGEMNSTGTPTPFSSWDGIPGNYAKLEGLLYEDEDEDDDDHYNNINNTSKEINGSAKFDDQKPMIPWVMERVGLDEHDQLISSYPWKVISEELGSSNFDIFQQL